MCLRIQKRNDYELLAFALVQICDQYQILKAIQILQSGDKGIKYFLFSHIRFSSYILNRHVIQIRVGTVHHAYGLQRDILLNDNLD